MRKVRADLHLHTCLSPCADSQMQAAAIVEQAAKNDPIKRTLEFSQRPDRVTAAQVDRLGPVGTFTSQLEGVLVDINENHFATMPERWWVISNA